MMSSAEPSPEANNNRGKSAKLAEIEIQAEIHSEPEAAAKRVVELPVKEKSEIIIEDQQQQQQQQVLKLAAKFELMSDNNNKANNTKSPTTKLGNSQEKVNSVTGSNEIGSSQDAPAPAAPIEKAVVKQEQSSEINDDNAKKPLQYENNEERVIEVANSATSKLDDDDHDASNRRQMNDDLDVSDSDFDTGDDDNEQEQVEEENDNDSCHQTKQAAGAATAAVAIKAETKADIDQPHHGVQEINDENSIKIDMVQEVKPSGRVRHAIAWLALSSILLANMNRQAFNHVLKDMVRPENSTSRHADDDRFDWTDKDTDTMKQYFSLGYCILMIPMGRLCEIIGTKWVVFVSGLGISTCSFLVPILADLNWLDTLKYSRFMMGIFQTAVSPALFALLSRWLSDSESNFYLPLLKSGTNFGLVLGTSIAGVPSWRLCFHVCSSITLLWTILWAFFVTSKPQENRFLKPEELAYIEQEIEKRDGKKASVAQNSTEDLEMLVHEVSKMEQEKRVNSSFIDKLWLLVKKEMMLWLMFILNVSVIGVILTKWTLRFSIDLQTQYFAQFMDKIHHFNNFQSSFANSANYFIQGVFTFYVVAMAKDFLSRKLFGLNKTGIRRLFQCACSFGMAASLLLITLDVENRTVTLTGLVLLALTNSLCAGADSMMPYDVSPTYSGSIMALSNSLANTAGVIVPALASAILGDDRGNPARWRNFLLILSAIIGSGGLVFLILVKAKIQPFDPAYAARKRQKELARKMGENEQKTREELELKPLQKSKIERDQLPKGIVVKMPSKLNQLTFEEWNKTKGADKPAPK